MLKLSYVQDFLRGDDWEGVNLQNIQFIYSEALNLLP